MAPPPTTPLSQTTNLTREEDERSRRKRSTPSVGEENAAPVQGTPSGALSNLSRLRARVDVMRRESVAHSFSDGPLAPSQSPWKKVHSPGAAEVSAGPGPGTASGQGQTWSRLRAALALFESTSFLTNCEAALSGKPRAPKGDFAAQKLEYQNLVKQLRACLRDTFAKKDALAREAVAIEGELSARLESLEAELLVEKDANVSFRRRVEDQEAQFQAALEEARKNAGLTSAEAQARLEKVLRAEAEIEKAEAAIEAQREALYQEEKARIGKEMGARGAALLAEVEAKKTKLEEKQVKMVQEAEEMRAEFAQMEHDMKLVAAEAEDARARAAISEQSRDEATSRLQALEAEFLAFRCNSEEEQANLKEAFEKERDELAAFLKETQENARHLEQQLEASQVESVQAQEALQAELQRTIAHWEGEFASMELQLTTEKNDANVRATELEGQLDLLHEKYNAHVAVSSERESELQHALQGLANESQQKHDALCAELEALRTSKEEVIASLERSYAELQQISIEKESNLLHELEQKEVAFQKDREELHAKLNEQEEQNVEAVSQLRCQLGVLEEEKERLLSELKEQNTELEEALQRTGQELEKAREEATIAITSLEDRLSTEAASAAKQIELLENELREQKESALHDKQEWEEELAHLNEKMAEREAELTSELNASTSELDVIKSRLEATMSELESTVEKEHKLKKELENVLAGATDLEHTLRQQLEDAEAKISEMKVEAADYQQSLAELHTKKSELDEELKSKCDHVNDLELALNELRETHHATLEELEQKIEQARVEASEREEELLSEIEENKKVADQHLEEALRVQHVHHQSLQQTSAERFEQELNQLLSMKAALEAEAAALKDALKNSQASISSAFENIESKAAEKAALEARCSQLDQECQALRQQLDNTKCSAEDGKNALLSQITELQLQNQDAKAWFENQLASAKDNFEEAKCQYEDRLHALALHKDEQKQYFVQQIDDLKLELANEVEAHSNAYKELSDELKALRDSSHIEKQELLAKMEEAACNHASEVDVLKAEITSLQGSSNEREATLREKIAGLQSDLKNLEESALEKDSERAETIKTLESTLEQRLNDYNKSLAELEMSHAQKVSELEDLLNSKCEEFATEQSVYQCKYQELSAAKDAEIESLLSKLEHAAELQVQTQQQKDMEIELLKGDSGKALEEAQAKLCKLREELEHTVSEKDLLICNLESKLNETLSMANAAEASLKEELASEVSKSKKMFEEQHIEIQRLEKELERTKSELETELEDAIEANEKARHDLELELSVAKQTFEKERAELLEEKSSLRGSMEAKVCALEEELNQAHALMKEQEEEMQARLSSAEATLSASSERSKAEMEQLHRSFQEERDTFGRERESLNCLVLEKERAFTEISGRIEELEQRSNEEAQALLEEKEALAAERNALDDRIRGLLAALASEKDEVSRLRVAANAAATAARAEANALRQEIKMAEAATEDSRRHAAALQSELNTLQDASKSSENRILEKLQQLSHAAELAKSETAKANDALSSARLAASQAQEEIRALQDQVLEAEAERRRLHNHIQELRGNVRVFARVRPPGSNQLSSCSSSITCLADGQGLQIAGASKRHAYSFDRVFGPESSQADVFDEVSGLVQSALDGYKVCLFSYGQTGSGKTHTMLGQSSGEERGIIPRAVEKVVTESKRLESKGWTFSMEASYVEIYNEVIRDLLNPGSGFDEKHSIVPNVHGTGCPMVSGVTRQSVASVHDADDLVRRASATRSVESTQMNATSSRSHALFMLYIVGTHEAAGQQLDGCLILVDLAGSERVSKSGAEGARLREACAINKSLSCLSDVFSAISSGQKHVPFRNSKLTHLLSPCLSGDGKTLMFVNLSPEDESMDESICSARFASHVNSCELGRRGGGAKRNLKSIQDSQEVPVSEEAPAPATRGRASRVASRIPPPGKRSTLSRDAKTNGRDTKVPRR